MQAYEVSAALIVADKATVPLRRILRMSEQVEKSFAAIKKASAGLFTGTNATKFADQLEGRVAPALQSVTDNLVRTKSAATFAFGQIDASVATTIGQVKTLTAELAAAAAAAKEIGAASRIPPIAGGSGRGGGGTGIHVGGPRMPIPMGPGHGHVSFRGMNTAAMVAGGLAGYGLFENVNLADAISRIIYTAGGNPGAAGLSGQQAKLRKQILDIYSKTGMPLSEIENAAIGMTRMLAPLPLDQRSGLFNQVISAAAMETRLKGGSLEENAEAMTGLLHQAGIYD